MNKRLYSSRISTFSFIISVLFILWMDVACVSKKKYDAALAEIARLSVDSSFQTYEQADVAYTKDSVIYNQKSEMLKKEYKIDTLKRQK